MATLGAVVVVTDGSAKHLVDVLGKAGAFPVVESGLADAPAAVREIQPVALVFADPPSDPSNALYQPLVRSVEKGRGPFMPVIVRAEGPAMVPIPGALPICASEPPDRLVAYLNSALRVRSQHAAVLRRAGSRRSGPPIPSPTTVEGITVLCVGRGRSYPVLTTAIGEQVGLIGAMSVETAGKYLNAREVDGLAIGDGFSPKVVEALLTVLGEDSRFRDLPVGVLGRCTIDDHRLANLVRIEGDPTLLVDRLLPFVRLHAFENALKRYLKSLDSDGVVDPDTGLLDHNVFWRDLDRAIKQAEEAGSALTVARFSFDDPTDMRSSIDAARLLSRLIRNIDFACRDHDGTIIAAFVNTDLRSAHVVARRIASVLRQTMVAPGLDRRTIRPTVTLAALKPTDNLSTLVARVGTYPKVAVV